MNKNLIVILMLIAFLCMYIPFGSMSRFFDIVGIVVLCFCAAVSILNKTTK